MLRRDLHEENRISWNKATAAHNSHKRDQASFFKHSGSTLFPEELSLLGEVSGRKMVHLQCNSGQDTLSLSLLGADVLGVDISDTAVEFAQQLSVKSGIDSRFERADIYDWFMDASKRQISFDIAFSSYGAIVWLSDLGHWAEGIASILRPGGRFVLVDFHPFLAIFDDDWNITYPYIKDDRPITWDPGIGDYIADSGPALAPSGYLSGIEGFSNPYPSHEFQWTVSDIFTALIKVGLTIEKFKEYPYSNGAKLLPGMKLGEKNRYYPPENLPRIPIMFGLSARLT